MSSERGGEGEQSTRERESGRKAEGGGGEEKGTEVRVRVRR